MTLLGIILLSVCLSSIPVHQSCPLKLSTPKIPKFYLFITACFVDHMAILLMLMHTGEIIRWWECFVIMVMTDEWSSISQWQLCFFITAALSTNVQTDLIQHLYLGQRHQPLLSVIIGFSSKHVTATSFTAGSELKHERHSGHITAILLSVKWLTHNNSYQRRCSPL